MQLRLKTILFISLCLCLSVSLSPSLSLSSRTFASLPCSLKCPCHRLQPPSLRPKSRYQQIKTLTIITGACHNCVQVNQRAWADSTVVWLRPSLGCYVHPSHLRWQSPYVAALLLITCWVCCFKYVPATQFLMPSLAAGLSLATPTMRSAFVFASVALLLTRQILLITYVITHPQTSYCAGGSNLVILDYLIAGALLASVSPFYQYYFMLD